MIVGGYRRGKQENNDIDILLCPQQGREADFLEKAVKSLRQNNIIIDILSLHQGHNLYPFHKAPNSNVMDSLDKCFAVVKVGDRARRVDLIVAPRKQWPFAVLGWTGSRRFERSIREYAKKEKRYRLSSHGLYDENNNEIPAEDEEDIFKVLSLKYIKPELRNC